MKLSIRRRSRARVGELAGVLVLALATLTGCGAIGSGSDPKADGSFPVAGTPLAAEGKSARLLAVFQACSKYWDGGISYS